MFDNFINVFKNNIDKSAILYNDELFSYGDLLIAIDEWTNFLIDNNILSGETVSIKADFSKNAIGLIFALIKNKNIIIPLDIKGVDNQNKLLISGAKYVFTFLENEEYKFEIVQNSFEHNYYDSSLQLHSH